MKDKGNRGARRPEDAQNGARSRFQPVAEGPWDMVVHTDRLRLIATTLELVEADLDGPDRLAGLLDASVSPSWPPGELDRNALEFFRSILAEADEAARGWLAWYVVERRPGDAEEADRLVAGAGFLGPPDDDGVVEVGYSVIPEARRRHIATETVEALVAIAFARGASKVIAHVREDNPGSIGVLVRNRFACGGPAEEPGMLRYERPFLDD